MQPEASLVDIDRTAPRHRLEKLIKQRRRCTDPARSVSLRLAPCPKCQVSRYPPPTVWRSAAGGRRITPPRPPLTACPSWRRTAGPMCHAVSHVERSPPRVGTLSLSGFTVTSTPRGSATGLLSQRG